MWGHGVQCGGVIYPHSGLRCSSNAVMLVGKWSDREFEVLKWGQCCCALTSQRRWSHLKASLANSSQSRSPGGRTSLHATAPATDRREKLGQYLLHPQVCSNNYAIFVAILLIFLHRKHAPTPHLWDHTPSCPVFSQNCTEPRATICCSDVGLAKNVNGWTRLSSPHFPSLFVFFPSFPSIFLLFTYPNISFPPFEVGPLKSSYRDLRSVVM